jgi:hypothetical protein
MNQARRIDRPFKEGELTGKYRGMSKDKKRQAAKDKRAQGAPCQLKRRQTAGGSLGGASV